MQGFILGLFVGFVFGALGVYYSTSDTQSADSHAGQQLATSNPSPQAAEPVLERKSLLSTGSNSQETGRESQVAARAVPSNVTKVEEAPIRSAAQRAKFTSPMLEGRIPGYPKLEDSSRALIDETRVLADSNRPEEAVKLLENALADNPNDEYLAIELAFANSEYLKDASRSEAVLRKLTKDKPDSKLAATALADFLTNQGRPAEATQSLRRAAQGEALPEAFAKLGQNLAAIRDLKGAQENYERAYQGFSAQEQTLAREGESTLFAERKRVAAALDLAFASLSVGKIEAAQALYPEILRVRGKEDPGVVALGLALSKTTGGKNAE